MVTDALTIPVAGGEQEFSEWRFRWMIANRGVDIVQPDLQYYGGLIRSMRVARMADLAGMPTTVHISGGFGFLYMLHFASFTPEIGLYQEYKLNIERYRGLVRTGPLRSGNGSLRVPEGPGVGIRDPAAVLRGAEEVRGQESGSGGFATGRVLQRLCVLRGKSDEGDTCKYVHIGYLCLGAGS